MSWNSHGWHPTDFSDLVGSSSPESDVSKYKGLLNDPHVNQLNFPGNSNTYQFNIDNLQHKKTICQKLNASIGHFVFLPLNFPIVVKTLHIPINFGRVNEKQLKTKALPPDPLVISEVFCMRKHFYQKMATHSWVERGVNQKVAQGRVKNSHFLSGAISEQPSIELWFFFLYMSIFS